MQLESSVKEKVAEIGLVPPVNPPIRIIVSSEED
jgi:hypothetical protein